MLVGAVDAGRGWVCQRGGVEGERERDVWQDLRVREENHPDEVEGGGSEAHVGESDAGWLGMEKWIVKCSITVVAVVAL